MSTKVYPDCEGAIRSYLRTVPEINVLVGQRIFLGFPNNTTEQTFPCVTLFEVGPGAIASSDAPLSWELIQFDCWGPGRQKSVARIVRDTLIGVLESISSGTMLDEKTRAIGARVFSSSYIPDPNDGQARYRIDAYVMASKTVS